MISRAELQRLANREKVALGVLEKDYVLTEVLKALSQVPTLKELLVFKGGTALRKVYFADWRYSEDLDFTVKHDLKQEELRQELGKWYEQTEVLSRIRLTMKMLHKPNGYARVRTQFIGPLAYPGMIFMDFSFDEPLCLDPDNREVLAAPFPSEGQKVLSYPLEELLAEKMRSLLERGKSRDYYDVWRLFKEKPLDLDLKLLVTVLLKKLAHKGLTISGIHDFIPRDNGVLKRYWEKELEQQIISIPSLDEVIEELSYMLKEYVAPYIGYTHDDSR